MQLIRCSIDGTRPKEKPCTLFWAWRDVEGGRHAFRQRLCLEHFLTNLGPLLADDSEERLHCPGCHIDIEDDYLITNCTAFVPGRGRQDISVALCAPCSAEVRTRAAQGSEGLPDREVGAENAAPTYSAWETLADLGRTP